MPLICVHAKALIHIHRARLSVRILHISHLTILPKGIIFMLQQNLLRLKEILIVHFSFSHISMWTQGLLSPQVIKTVSKFGGKAQHVLFLLMEEPFSPQ